MRRLEILKTTALWVLAVWALFILIPFENIIESDDVTTRRFCAYGHVYVEFQKGSHVWGTTFLDKNGKPVECDEDLPVENTSINKGNII